MNFAMAQSSQQQQIDLLRKVISQFDGKEKLDEYKRLIQVYYTDKADTVLLQLYDDMDAEARRQGDFDGQSYAKYGKMKTFNNNLMFDEIIEMAPKYLEFFRNQDRDDHIDYYSIYYIMTHAFIVKGDTVAIVEAQRMYEQAKAQQNNAGMALALVVMAEINVGILFRMDEGIKTFKDAIDLFDKCNNPDLFSMHANAYIRLCKTLMEKNRLDEALEMMHRYEQLIRRMEVYRPDAGRWSSLWDIYTKYYLRTGDYDKAEMYCDKFDSIMAAPVMRIIVANYKVDIFAGRGQYDKAIEMYDTVLKLAAAYDKRIKIFESPAKMTLLAKAGRTDELLKLALQTIEANDSVYRRDLAYQVDELSTKYDVDKHVREKEFMLRYIFILIAAVIIILLLWTYHGRIITGKNLELKWKISELNAQFIESERRYEQERNLNAAINADSSDGNDNDDNDIKKEILFFRLNKKVKKIISKAEVPTLDSLAKELNVSKRALANCVKNNTGVTFNDYITYLRLNYARELLADVNNQCTVEAIFSFAGFSSKSTFYRLFKASYGVTPDEFKKSVQKNSKTDV
jgi:AraC-like DNA-binding protein